MRVLVPMDDSECSRQALDRALDLAGRHDGTVDVIHYTEKPSDSVISFRDRVAERIRASGVDAGAVEVETDVRLGRPRTSDLIGKRVLRRADADGADEVVMGHHGTGRLGRALLGSAAATVVRGSDVPVTVVP
ncbi:MAG: universal stress protein [Haloferacaceae archaeon]